MKNISKILPLTGLALAVFVLSACSTQRFNLGNSENIRTPAANELQVFFISGIGQTRQIDAAAICRGASKVVAVEFQQSLLDSIIGGVTFGLITPRTAKVYCK